MVYDVTQLLTSWLLPVTMHFKPHLNTHFKWHVSFLFFEVFYLAAEHADATHILTDVFFHQLLHSPPWSCVRTTLVWPLTSVLWGMSPPTTSPSSSGHLYLILLWVNILFFSKEQFNYFLLFVLLILTKPNFPSQVRDYSGTYTVKLIPCTSPPSLEYTIPPVCNPREPLTFDVDIRFQQVTSPCLKWDRKK